MAQQPLLMPESASKTRLAPRWNVVLLDDDDHTYDYVVEMLQAIFGHELATAFRMAVEVDTSGRVVVWTGHRELAELRQEQIHAFGPDPLLARCMGSMTAILEPVD